jgi:hypothetical protein
MVAEYRASDLRDLTNYARARTALLATRPQSILLALALVLFFVSQRDVPSLLFGLVGVVWLLEALFVRARPWYITLNTITSLGPGVAFIGLSIVYRGLRPDLWANVALGIGIFSLGMGVLMLFQLQRVHVLLRKQPAPDELGQLHALWNELWRDPDTVEYTAQLQSWVRQFRVKQLHPDAVLIVGETPSQIWVYELGQLALDLDPGQETAAHVQGRLQVDRQSIRVMMSTAHASRVQAWLAEPRPPNADTAHQRPQIAQRSPRRLVWAVIGLSALLAAAAIAPFVLHRASLSVANLPEGQRVAATQQWRLLLKDDFSSRNQNRWPDGAFSIRDNSPAWFSCKLAGDLKCTFSLDRVSAQTIYPPDVNPIGTFYLAADLFQLEGDGNDGAGLLFRRSSQGHYLFVIYPRVGRFQIWRLQHGAYDPLTKALALDTIRDGASNRVAVLAEGDQFWFYINGTLATSVRDSVFPEGQVGVGAIQLAPGESRISVDNFELRAP